MASMTEAIQMALADIQSQDGVVILYACESGSRAWGFPSADSDYDVRFLYLRPRNWYLSIDLESRRDVIERPIDDGLDVSGWDLRKALLLFQRSNPPLLEWLGSPIVYLEQHSTAARLRALAATSFSARACMHHYLHMAEGNYRDYLKGEVVRTKKYFYLLRPLLAVTWLERGLGVVPTEFERLVDGVLSDRQLRDDIAELIEQKRRGAELDRGPRIASISGYIDAEMARLSGRAFGAEATRPDMAALNALFRDTLDEVWG